MSQLIKTNQQSIQKSTRPFRVVAVCAWCPASSHTPLKRGEVYTHGMCSEHLAEWTKRVRKRLHN